MKLKKKLIKKKQKMTQVNLGEILKCDKSATFTKCRYSEV
jgi:hypothetical protein